MSSKQFVNKRKALVVLDSPLFWKVNELDLHTLHTEQQGAAFCRRCAKWCQLLGIWRLEPHFSLAGLLSSTLETSSYWLSFLAASRAAIRRWAKLADGESATYVHCTFYSFITCVFGIVLRSADYSRCTETRPRYFLRVSEFFSDSDKILLAVAEAALGAHEAEPGKPANVEWDPEEVTSSSTFLGSEHSVNFSVGYIQIQISNQNRANTRILPFKFSKPISRLIQSQFAP